MSHMLASALVLAACLFGLVLSPRQSARVQFSVDVAALAAISLALWNAGESPLLLSAAPATTIANLWLRALAIGWWLFACRSAVSLLDKTSAVILHELGGSSVRYVRVASWGAGRSWRKSHGARRQQWG